MSSQPRACVVASAFSRLTAPGSPLITSGFAGGSFAAAQDDGFLPSALGPLPSASEAMENAAQDRLEIADLINRLGACLDEHRFDEIAEVIAEDATASTPGGEAEGRVAVIAQATRNHHDYAHLQHMITNVLIDLDGDHAVARANLHGTFIDAFGRVALELGAVYRFKVKRTADGWRLARIEVTPLWRKSAA